MLAFRQSLAEVRDLREKGTLTLLTRNFSIPAVIACGKRLSC